MKKEMPLFWLVYREWRLHSTLSCHWESFSSQGGMVGPRPAPRCTGRNNDYKTKNWIVGVTISFPAWGNLSRGTLCWLNGRKGLMTIKWMIMIAMVRANVSRALAISQAVGKVLPCVKGESQTGRKWPNEVGSLVSISQRNCDLERLSNNTEKTPGLRCSCYRAVLLWRLELYSSKRQGRAPVPTTCELYLEKSSQSYTFNTISWEIHLIWGILGEPLKEVIGPVASHSNTANMFLYHLGLHRLLWDTHSSV